MAIKGLSKPVCANYTAEGNTVTYSDVYAADKAVEYSFEADVAEDKDLYADNQVAETAAGRFVSGKLTLKTADLPPELSKKILGLKTATRQVGEETVTEVIYDDDQAAPYLGFGIIEEHQIDNKTGYLPVVFPKVRFSIPEDAATTRGDEVDWQTKEISGTVVRSDQVDDNYNHPWKIMPQKMYATEAEALKYNNAVLGTRG
ncbi:phage tail protein [Anaerobutyricum hallii]|uniref:Phage tail protein n=1 Tax=Anaerobutyricum hallii TaxID=39488 RepID=A0A414B835_9FIRM|nr:major tail protein [Anaerobutyricum hallii]RHC66954.1 phage tail protein [Anaerobutyricum hallii]